ncbi:MAG: hypothetical protein KF767_08215 [Bdellovibrionaceae bacterium]|nr:hypothetical protein [Pseudobdellovibrionaceae bacterium]
MKKIAIFVEGQTEQIFFHRLLIEIAGKNRIQINNYKLSGGSDASPRVRSFVGRYENSEAEVFVSIFDSGADNRVASDVRDNYDSLVKSGYGLIFGVRDVFPQFSLVDIPKLRTGLMFRIKTKPVEPVFILGVMEIEAWFIAEHSHFGRLDSRLTDHVVRGALGVDPKTFDLRNLPGPADSLHIVYSKVGRAYRKRKNQVEDTVERLDYAEMYLNFHQKFEDADVLFTKLQEYLS